MVSLLLAVAECRGRVRQAQVAGLAGAPDGATSWIAGSLAAQLPLDGIHMCHVGLGWALHLNPRWHIHGAVGRLLFGRTSARKAAPEDRVWVAS